MKICPICKRSDLKSDKHHIHSKCYSDSYSGKINGKYNLCDVCVNCHRRIHLGELLLEGIFPTTSGERLVWRYKGEESITGFPDPKCFIIGMNIKKTKWDKLLNEFLYVSW